MKTATMTATMTATNATPQTKEAATIVVSTLFVFAWAVEDVDGG